jgi:hypothetical protein
MVRRRYRGADYGLTNVIHFQSYQHTTLNKKLCRWTIWCLCYPHVQVTTLTSLEEYTVIAVVHITDLQRMGDNTISTTTITATTITATTKRGGGKERMQVVSTLTATQI